MLEAGEFEVAISRLALCLGEAGPENLDDEHQRWELYRKAMQTGTCREELLKAVSLDPDVVLGTGVALHMLEIEDPNSRQDWIGILRDDHQREYAFRRAREVEILEAFGNISGLSGDVVETWSDWLQIRLAEVSNVTEVLELLAKFGRTKRIRRIASARHKVR
ncbi:hypothetical protein [Catellatospora sp. NPDC049111]|uniref:hypothetical protein n=1 Tax=unclassified Catellatospora TaxID=2645785 RepID=UPI0033D50BF6